ncbi:MAG TPA: hypothetical protein VK693_09035 [Steroidobacteraceae bacterium]|nr:hypothetical protein [Steroidobacteraceae bacterium]
MDFASIRFDFAVSRAEHRNMERLNHTRTVAAALVQLQAAGLDRARLCVRVDALVNAHLASFIVSARQTQAMRKILGDEFLSLAPLTELSYRMWRRIMLQDTDLPEPVLRVESDRLLPDVDFGSQAA